MNKHGFRHIHALSEGGKRFIWNVERLWELADELAPDWVDVDSIEGVDRKGWFSHTAPTLRNVALHAKRIFEADLSYPIILNADGSIMDGAHRVARALVEDRPRIRAVRFESQPPPDVVEDLAR